MMNNWFPESTDDEQLRQIAAIFSGAGVLIATHENPDGDAFGSMLGLAELLKPVAASVHMYVEQSAINADFAFLPGWDKIGNHLPSVQLEDVVPEVVVIVDCNHPSRVGPNFVNWLKSTGINPVLLDHHVSDADLSEREYIRTSAPSACSIVAELALACSWAVSESAAICLYTGLVTDTGFFSHSNATAESFRLAAVLVRAGARPNTVSEALQSTLSIGRLKLLKNALASLRYGQAGSCKWASLTVTSAVLAESGADEKDAAGLIDYVRHLAGVNVAFVVRQRDEVSCKISMRSRAPFDVQALTSALGGGGHKFAAGATVPGTPEEVHEKLREEVERLG